MFEQARQDASDLSVIGWASILHIDNELGLAGLILGPSVLITNRAEPLREPQRRRVLSIPRHFRIEQRDESMMRCDVIMPMCRRLKGCTERVAHQWIGIVLESGV